MYVLDANKKDSFVNYESLNYQVILTIRLKSFLSISNKILILILLSMH